MRKDERDLLDVLKFELYYLTQGGYEKPSSATWRPRFIFEDSPSCANYNATDHRVRCSDCVLMDLVPFERRFAKIPCRFIPMSQSGETLDSMYRYSDQEQIEETVEQWLKSTIQGLEEKRAEAQRVSLKPTSAGESMIGTPLYQNLHPKCANPACPAAFHWTGGGKFFRFRPDPISPSENITSADTPESGITSQDSNIQKKDTSEMRNEQTDLGVHGLRHYWLCEKCCHVFTLVFEETQGVMVRLLWPELPALRAVPKRFPQINQ